MEIRDHGWRDGSELRTSCLVYMLSESLANCLTMSEVICRHRALNTDRAMDLSKISRHINARILDVHQKVRAIR
ncbi:hypothetical protein KL942_001851 [Ogataea angusta]|uniref:Uncharacterized protein n=1 Tax=Pichia angusta TaxID=870730 RepID=A0ABQ7RY04_PICAN|nr:hypothetical protein KL942_001851 [Ogataea angusta]KAG7849986.1 hypothetical protein KL940_002354 [Ogataea angusta]